MMKWWLVILAACGILAGAVIMGCIVYQQSAVAVAVAAPKEKAPLLEEQKLIPEDAFDGVLERYKRRDIALDLEQAHNELYVQMKEAAKSSKGDVLDAALYAMALSYLDKLSIETAHLVLEEAEQPQHDKNIREMVAYSNNTEKARMIVLFEMEYLKSEGLVAKND